MRIELGDQAYALSGFAPDGALVGGGLTAHVRTQLFAHTLFLLHFFKKAAMEIGFLSSSRLSPHLGGCRGNGWPIIVICLDLVLNLGFALVTFATFNDVSVDVTSGYVHLSLVDCWIWCLRFQNSFHWPTDARASGNRFLDAGSS